MNKLMLSILLILSMSCNMDNEKSKQLVATNNIEEPIMVIEDDEEIESPYEIELGILKQENDIYDLTVEMKLNNGSHFVSPNAVGDFSGKFKFIIDYNDIVKQQSNLIETPLSKEEYDPHPFVNGNINWVKENTTYKQQIKISKYEEFQVMGFIQFTIEPSCTLEKIPIIIKYQDGKMKFEVFKC